MPELYIITGSNGAGKSSIGFRYIPDEFHNHIFDGDKLFLEKKKELWEIGPKIEKEVRKNAGAFVSQKFEQLVSESLLKKTSFAYEGHFTNEATWAIPMKFKQAGYTVNIVFLGLNDTKLSESRVKDRTAFGGHFVDQRTIENNFFGNLEKLNIHFSIADNLVIIDTSETEHIFLANFRNGIKISSIPFSDLPSWFVKYLPDLAYIIQVSISDQI